jgi:hypothetical protein
LTHTQPHTHTLAWKTKIVSPLKWG